jgi:beta-glucosidase-like glycosyl hydrolase
MVGELGYGILYVKFKMGLFEQPTANPALLQSTGSPAQHALAREAVTNDILVFFAKIVHHEGH